VCDHPHPRACRAPRVQPRLQSVMDDSQSWQSVMDDSQSWQHVHCRTSIPTKTLRRQRGQKTSKGRRKGRPRSNRNSTRPPGPKPGPSQSHRAYLVGLDGVFGADQICHLFVYVSFRRSELCHLVSWHVPGGGRGGWSGDVHTHFDVAVVVGAGRTVAQPARRQRAPQLSPTLPGRLSRPWRFEVRACPLFEWLTRRAGGKRARGGERTTQPG
jgi:hypothetical protein